MYLFNVHTSTHLYVLCVCMQVTQLRKRGKRRREGKGREGSRKGREWVVREGGKGRDGGGEEVTHSESTHSLLLNACVLPNSYVEI